MSKAKLLSDRLQEVLINGTWIANTNFKHQISSITWNQAMHKIDNLNSIALLTYHINYYLAGLNTVFKGGSLEIRDKHSFDMPPITSAQDWNQLKEIFIDNSTLFIAQVAKLDDEILDMPFVDEKYGTYQRNIEGVIEHAYYHLGQVSLIKKMLECDNARM